MRCVVVVCLLLLPTAGWAAPADDARQAALNRAAALAERFGQFEDVSLAVNSLSALGRRVCKYDAPSGRAILHQAATAFRAYRADDINVDGLRGILLHRVAACAAALVDPIREITEPDANEPARSAPAILEAARALLKTDAAQAAEMAAPAIPAAPSMNGDQSWDLVRFLFDLGEKDYRLSDRLFRKALAQFRASAGGSWDSLQFLGNYMFGPPGEERNFTSTELDGVEVYDWRARRPQASNESVRLYVRTVAEALSAPPDGLDDGRLRSMMARQLEPFARTEEPQLLPVLEEASLTVEMEPRFPGRTMEDYLTDSARSSDPRIRTQAKLHRFRLLWEAGKFDEAAEAATRITDTVLRAHLNQLTDYGRAARALREEEPERSYTLSAKLTDSHYQTLIHLELASAHLRSGDMQATRRSITLASHGAAKTHPIVKPKLLLSIAALQAKAEPESALSTLAEAVRLSSQPHPKRRRGFVMRAFPGAGGFIVPLRGSDGWFYATLFLRTNALGGFDFASAARRFADFDLDRLDAILEDLRDESELSAALTTTCELRLKGAFAENEDK